MRDAIVNASDDISDVTIRDLVVEGSVRPEPPSDPNSARSYRNQGNRGGIIFRAQQEGQMKNISMINLTVQNCTFNGVVISGATGVSVTRCDFTENGSSVVPGPMLQHNLLLTHGGNILVEDSRLDTSPYGSGIAIDQCNDVRILRNEVARNAYFGVLVAESDNVTISENFIEGNDRSGVMVEFQYRGSSGVTVSNNQIQFNDGYGVESYAARNSRVSGNRYVKNSQPDEKVSSEKQILMK
jgi:parallel beta-helix repeat protein